MYRQFEITVDMYNKELYKRVSAVVLFETYNSTYSVSFLRN